MATGECMDWSALLSFVEKFRDFVFRPFTLLALGLICLTLLILPEPYLVRIGFDNLVKQHKTALPIATIIFLVAGFIRFCDVYIFSWIRQKRQQKGNRDSFQHRLNTLSKHELLILAYCLSRNRITFFVIDQGRNSFEEAVRSLTTRGFFKQGPLAIQGYSFDITDDYWPLLQRFKDDIRKRSEAVNPDWEQKFGFYDGYQKAHGFEQVEIRIESEDSILHKLYQKVFGSGQVETSSERKEIASESQALDPNYTLYTKDVFLDVIWKWHYKPEFGQKPLNLTPHCPDCEQRLVPKTDLDGNAIYIDRRSNKPHIRLICSVHRKQYRMPIDEQKNYVTVIADISKKIKNGKWKEIVEQQRK
jgi:hypothetical protein